MNKIHELTMHNRHLLEKYQLCVCSYCLREYNLMKIVDWCDDGMTAICPYCWIDSVYASPKVCSLYVEKDILDDHKGWGRTLTNIQFTDEETFSLNEIQKS